MVLYKYYRTFICVIRTSDRDIEMCSWRGGGGGEVEARKKYVQFQLKRVFLDIAVVLNLRLCSRLGDTGLLQPCLGDVGLGFCQAVNDYLSEEGQSWEEQSDRQQGQGEEEILQTKRPHWLLLAFLVERNWIEDEASLEIARSTWYSSNKENWVADWSTPGSRSEAGETAVVYTQKESIIGGLMGALSCVFMA